MIEFIKYIIIGLIQGITEVLPVSSSGHLTIVEHMMGINNDNLAFEVFLHLASFIAVIAFLYKPLIKIIKGSFLYLFKKKKNIFGMEIFDLCDNINNSDCFIYYFH
ncbi:MAG: undecaprenyl-diphosphate phosphatase [Christensenellales bacterium]